MSVLRALLFATIAAASVSAADAGPRDRDARARDVVERVRDQALERVRDDDRSDRQRERLNFNRRDHENVRDRNPFDESDDDGDGSRDRGPITFDRDRGPDHDRARQGVAQGKLLPLEVVLANVARQIPGHHIGVDGPYQQGGRWVYRIKWLTPDGRVIIVIADAETGQILGTRGR